MAIRALPALLVNQIAAGEVIERPASVIKELIENAVDAGARSIDVDIEDGGRELIRVRDDGSGMSTDDLPLAVAPHATSKIARASDLDAIATMGFRGEALASIASVSRMRILTRTKHDTAGAMLDVEGATVGRVQPHAAAIGTTVTVRNLFFNTPARRKFLRTAPTEASRIAQTVDAIALAHPHIGFTLTSEGRTRSEFPPVELPSRRVLAVIGEELRDQLLEVNFDRMQERGIMIWGLIGMPDIARSNANHQRLYLNGRPIRDRSLQHALREAYRGLIEPGRYPTLVLFIEMNPKDVDVNVHPAKAEVRFRNQSMVHGTVLGAVRNRLRDADLTPRFDLSRTGGGSIQLGQAHLPRGAEHARPFGSGVPAASDNSGSSETSDASGASKPVTTPREFVDFFHRLDAKQKGFVYSEVKQALERESPDVIASIADDVAGTDAGTHGGSAGGEGTLPSLRQAIDILQVHSSYLVTQDEEGLLIIDQHALHERVMFEKLLERVSGGGALESQRLLMPEVIEVDRAEVALLDDMRQLLERIGVDAEQMGPSSIAIHAFPSFLFDRRVEIVPFVKELLGKALDDGLPNDIEAALHETLDMMACKAAVKAGDRLSGEELKELMKHRHDVERSSNCPHGRPTTLRLSIRDLDKQFGRT